MPTLKRFIQYTLLELNTEKIKLDEADWYFCLRRKGYRFRGIPLETRLAEKERIDKEKGHVIPKIMYQNA